MENEKSDEKKENGKMTEQLSDLASNSYTYWLVTRMAK